MAAASQQDSLEEELTCSICLQIYIDPVILTCNHSFCRACVEKLWKEPVSGSYSCPQCRASFKVRPRLEKNFQLANIVQKYKGLGLSQDVVPCSYCTKKQRPAVKTCLKCKISMCSIHLKPHQVNMAFKSCPLVDPIVNVAGEKCIEHQELLKVYCKDDEVCVCSLCALVGDHKGHNLISINEAVKELKNNLDYQRVKVRINTITVQGTLENLQKEKENTLEMMKKTKRSIEEKYKARRQQIEDEENKVLKQLNREQSRVTAVIDARILKLQNKVKEFEKSLTDLNNLSINEDVLFIKAHLKIASGRMNNLVEPLDKPKIAELIKYPVEQEKVLRDRGEMIRLYGQTPTLDPDTAHPSLILFDSNSTVLAACDTQPYPDSPDRFDSKGQVLCSAGVSYGCSYWEVKPRVNVGWKVGVCYRSINRKGRGNECSLGQNDKSWCVQTGMFSFTALHNRSKTKLTGECPTTVGVFVDFDCGIISFYSVSGNSLTLLHTFHQTFTEPLYPVLEIASGTVLTISGVSLISQ
ncbi:E3 ubiquitin/ISG15 ligase TRIM25-like [Heptranchias perlo]|uniref:E3 ubiquitin/ISG15 ligase TRIM25-like n=1 Tax=Heptranchias perlo TaxID=212740 RepID=UPI00355A368C